MSGKRAKALRKLAQEQARDGSISSNLAYHNLKKRYNNPSYARHTMEKGESGAYGSARGKSKSIFRTLDKLAGVKGPKPKKLDISDIPTA